MADLTPGAWRPGQAVTWLYEARRGYRSVTISIKARVVRSTGTHVVIAINQLNGRVAERTVKRETLRARGQEPGSAP